MDCVVPPIQEARPSMCYHDKYWEGSSSGGYHNNDRGMSKKKKVPKDQNVISMVN